MRNAWYPILLSNELKTGRVHPTKIFGDPVVLFRAQGGPPACFLDSCPHRSIPFSLGHVSDGQLTCAYHGWQYASDGRCVHMPLLPEGKSIPRSAVARTYPTLESHGFIWVWPGDPAQADPARLPLPFAACAGNPHTHTITTWFESRFDLVIDHGLDMPHFFQLHARTLVGFNPALKAGFPALERIEEDANALTVMWRLRRRGVPKFLKVQALHPSCIFTELPLDIAGKAILQHLVFFTPIDQNRTRGFLRVHRNFLNVPILGYAIDRIYERIMAVGRAEDDAIFHGQLANEELGARSSTSWPFDSVSARYLKWQAQRSSHDMWFRDLDHARKRYLLKEAA